MIENVRFSTETVFGNRDAGLTFATRGQVGQKPDVCTGGGYRRQPLEGVGKAFVGLSKGMK